MYSRLKTVFSFGSCLKTIIVGFSFKSQCEHEVSEKVNYNVILLRLAACIMN